MDSITKEIIDNYTSFDEDSRLKSPYGILEEEHTRCLIAAYLQPAPMEIYDVGGGTGPYSAWLAEVGHHIHFSDLVPKHVELFNTRFGGSKNIISSKVEDARKLSYEDNVADLIILNGPLYHLIDKADRLQVLTEAKRILKDTGFLLGVSISRFAGLFYALSSGEVFNDDYFGMVNQEIATGIRDNRMLKNKTFSTAYFHTVDEIEAEFVESGLQVKTSLGVVGPAWEAPDLAIAIGDPAKKQRLMLVADMMKHHPMYSPKILTVGGKA